jgi:hypothetical protein
MSDNLRQHVNTFISHHYGEKVHGEAISLMNRQALEIDAALALLEQAECPNADGITQRCIGGQIFRLNLKGEHTTLICDCSWCAERKQLLGERG